MNDEMIETILQADKKERLLQKILVWLRSKDVYNQCMKDCGEEQLIKND